MVVPYTDLEPVGKRDKEAKADHVCGNHPFDIGKGFVELFPDHRQRNVDDAAVNCGHHGAQHKSDKYPGVFLQNNEK